jgi:DNA-binding MarR family transcriptional regulator
MQPASEIPVHGLFAIVHELVDDELFARLREAGYSELRPTHACVFGTIRPEGNRLTELAERADMTKQAVGEVVSELEAIGYVERVPDPSDGRAKIIKLTERGLAAWGHGWGVVHGVQERWEKRYGKKRVRDAIALIADVVDDERAATAGDSGAAAA